MTHYTISEQIIGPEEAAELLALNTRNRALSVARVNDLARMMRQGLWKRTPAPIVKGPTLLWNGQHRLAAVVQSGTRQWFLVVDVDSDAGFDEIMPTLDIGKPRSLADVLALRGYKRAGLLAALVNGDLSVNYWQHGGTTGGARKGIPTLTRADQLAHLAKHEHLTDLTERAHTIGRRLGVPASWWGVLLHQLGHRSEELADDYVGGVLEPGTGDIRETVRDRLARIDADPRRIPPSYAMTILVVGWNAYVTGRDLRIIKVAVGAPFPRIEDPLP